MNDAETLRRMGCTDAMIATATVCGVPLVKVKPAAKRSDGWPGYRSKWEALYAVELDYQKSAGEIVDWAYEPITFRLSESCVVDGHKVRAITYTPDFVCWLPDGKMRCIEIKGFRNTSAINRYKIAKDTFRSVEFIMVKHVPGGWERMLY